MSLSIGIVGLPNVGKSTLFTALTRKGGLAANYPFATIDPNVGVVDVPDARLQQLAEIAHPGRIVPATVEFVDIAGLVKGANEGEGLGNQFLANIRETDAICEVVRYFTDPNVMRETGRVGAFVDPSADADTIMTELILADIQTLEKQLPKLEKEAKRDKEQAGKFDVAKRLLAWLNEGNRAATMDMTDDERAITKGLFLLTMKPLLYVANVDEDALGAEVEPIDGEQPIPICAKVEAELSELEPEEAAEYLSDIGLERSGLETLAQAAYKLLGLQSYFRWKLRHGLFLWVQRHLRLRVLSTPILSADLLKLRLQVLMTILSLVAKLVARRRASSAWKEKITSCRTAMSCTLGLTCKDISIEGRRQRMAA